VGVLVKTAFDTLSNSLTAPFQKGAPTVDLEAFAQNLGVTVDDLKALKDSQE